MPFDAQNYEYLKQSHEFQRSWFNMLWQDIMKRDSARGNTVAELLNANAELYDVIRDEPHHMGEAAAQSAAQ